MIRSIVAAASIGCSLAVTATATQAAEVSAVNSFEEMADLAFAFSDGNLGSLLIVMDDDDTLTQVPCTDQSAPATCQYLGGPAWYSWQEGLIGATPASPYQIADTEDDLIALSAMIFGLMDMGYTDPAIPTMLSDLSAGGDGAKMLVLTARGGSDVSPTQTQFADLNMGTGGQSFADFISANGLIAMTSGLPSLASPATLNGPSDACSSSRDMTYADGVMYVAGQNKGTMLHCLLERTDAANVDYIVFIDETLANVKDVAAAFPGGVDEPEVLALHYTRLEAHKAALTDGPDADRLQQIANERWEVIRAALLATLLSPIPALR